MTVADVIRIFVPSNLRIAVGLKAISLASHNETTLKIFLAMLYGTLPGKIGLTKTHSYYNHNGHHIIAEKHGAGAFLEIFQSEVYERIYKPQANDVVVDIGAYVGMFTVKASDAVGKNGLVIAVEPSPENYELLRANTKDCENVKLVNVAIMDKEGEGKLYYSEAAAANSLILNRSGKYVTVKTMTLDKLVDTLQIKKVDYIKIDAEGAELEVLAGATEVLAKGTKIVIVAYHTTANGEAEIDRVIEFLVKAGYTVTMAKGLRSYVHAEKAS